LGVIFEVVGGDGEVFAVFDEVGQGRFEELVGVDEPQLPRATSAVLLFT
jgi:hypothetical protein